MKTVVEPIIRFEQVSKQYNLGLTRTSLPSVITNWIKSTAGKVPRIPRDEKLLWALKDVSFELERGQSLALIGANGAGKTTTLKLLANITKPTTGKIEINGQLTALIELGAGFHPDLTGRENIFLNGSILGLKRKYLEQRFDEIVAFSELERFIDTPVKRYSSGMMVRLGFAVAASIEPDILLVDEVLAVGDASFRHKCVNRIRELLDMGTSIIFVSHNLWQVRAVCSSALYLRKGQIKHSGEISEVIERYDRDISEDRAKEFDMDHTDQSTTTAEVEITTIEILDQESGITGGLQKDQPAEVRVHYTAFKAILDINVVVRIIRSDGLTCCMIRTSVDQETFTLKPGSGMIMVTLDPLQLYGGTYYVQAIVRDSSDSFPLSAATSDWFYVSGGPQSFNEMNGVFEPRHRWDHHQNSTPLAKQQKQLESRP